MNKFVLLILTSLLGIVYFWSGVLIYPFLPFDVDFVFVLILFPSILCIPTVYYFVKNKLGYISIVGLFIGIFIGIILASFALSGL